MHKTFPAIAILLLLFLSYSSFAQITDAERTGFSWISTENVEDMTYGSGYTFYSAAWPIFDQYPGAEDFQMGLAGCWLTPQLTGNEPTNFYNTIEGGLGWWHNTRFGTRIPKFIMGGVSNDFYAWANGPGEGRTDLLPNGQRDWSTPGGKYGVAQLSNRLVWAPDGLNMAQSLNGELLGYGYTPLPLSEALEETEGQDIVTGNQYWTLFLNTTNFKGPATCFLPTFWTEPVLEDPALEGLFLDSRPSDPNLGFGWEHAVSPAILSTDSEGDSYAKIEPLQLPVSGENNSISLSEVTMYSQEALWNNMQAWFEGGPAVEPGMVQTGSLSVSFANNGGDIVGEIGGGGEVNEIDLSYISNIQQATNVSGFEFDLNTVDQEDGYFKLPEYFRLDEDNFWRPVAEEDVPESANLVAEEVPTSLRSEITYLTPLESDCAWQDPTGPWNSPGPQAGPFYTDLGDGTTLTYYWYRFVDQPAVVHANLPEETRALIQERVELLHTNWSHEDDYVTDPELGQLATLDPGTIVQPPAGMEIGYVPIATRQELSTPKVRVFVLAGQSNMQGYGVIADDSNPPNTLVDVVSNDTEGNWSEVGAVGDWTTLEDAYLYFDNDGEITSENITVGQGAFSDLIGPELMFAHELDAYYEDPVLIIKTAWGGKNLAVDFRPPSAGGTTGDYYNQVVETVQNVTQNLNETFPDLAVTDFELTGFAWFQGWNDGETDAFLEEYESNMYNLVDDIRIDLNAPDLALVIASSGHGGYVTSPDLWVQDMQNTVSVAQETVGCDDELYGGKVGFVDTKPFYLDASESPDDAIHHFHNNALTFLNIGKGLGEEMILAINDMAYCNIDCVDQIAPGVVTIGNRVWNDLNMDGINDADEPGIPGVSLVLWSDSDSDGIPDSGGFGGVQVTDADGYYSFGGLVPGNYTVFVWSVDNWEEGQPLFGWQSTGGFVGDANNDIDLDNNGSGEAFTDIMSGIVTLSSDGEPLNDGDPFDCFFNYDASGNNTVDFGFFNPNANSVNESYSAQLKLYPNPASDVCIISGDLSASKIRLIDSVGRLIQTIYPDGNTHTLDLSDLPKGMYFLEVLTYDDQKLATQKLLKK